MKCVNYNVKKTGKTCRDPVTKVFPNYLFPILGIFHAYNAKNISVLDVGSPWNQSFLMLE
jgi:hypothetical protein